MSTLYEPATFIGFIVSYFFFPRLLFFLWDFKPPGYEERSPISALCKSSISMKTVSLVWASLSDPATVMKGKKKERKKERLNSCVRNTPRILFFSDGKT